MELSAFWAAMLRRWYLVLVAVVATLAMTTLTVNKVGPTYTAEGTVLLFPPTTTVERGSESVTEGNPYLFLGGLNQARDILIRSLTSSSSREAIKRQVRSATFEMVPDLSTSGPVIAVNVGAPTRAEALQALDAVVARVPDQLSDMQSGLGLARSALITSKVLTLDTKPKVVRKGQIRAGIVAGAGTLALSLLLIGLFDGLWSARRRRQQNSGKRARRDLPEEDEPAHPGPLTDDSGLTGQAVSLNGKEYASAARR